MPTVCIKTIKTICTPIRAYPPDFLVRSVFGMGAAFFCPSPSPVRPGVHADPTH